MPKLRRGEEIEEEGSHHREAVERKRSFDASA